MSTWNFSGMFCLFNAFANLQRSLFASEKDRCTHVNKKEKSLKKLTCNFCLTFRKCYCLSILYVYLFFPLETNRINLECNISFICSYISKCLWSSLPLPSVQFSEKWPAAASVACVAGLRINDLIKWACTPYCVMHAVRFFFQVMWSSQVKMFAYMYILHMHMLSVLIRACM